LDLSGWHNGDRDAVDVTGKAIGDGGITDINAQISSVRAASFDADPVAGLRPKFSLRAQEALVDGRLSFCHDTMVTPN